MLAEEWPLILFTFLSQSAIGLFIILIIIRSILAKKAGPETAEQLTLHGIFAVGPIMGVSLLLSFFHLGKPILAYGAIFNIGTSWLSREILFSGLFFFLWFVYSYISFVYSYIPKNQNTRKGLAWLTSLVGLLQQTLYNRKTGLVGLLQQALYNRRNGLAWFTSLVGLLAIFSMSSVYTASVRRAWADPNTFIAFFGTTFFLGSIIATAFVAYNVKEKEISAEVLSVQEKTFLAAFFSMLVQLIYIPMYLAGFSGGEVAALLPDGLYAFPTILRWFFSFSGLIIIGYLLYNQKRNLKGIPAKMIYIALALVVFGEIIGRCVFYASGHVTGG